MSSKIKIGWSEVNMTPDKPISLAGQFYERISEYVESPLTVTAMAIDCDGDQAVICSTDLVSVSEDLVQAVRERLEGKLDLDPRKIVIGAIHTHTSFVYNHRTVSQSSSSLDILRRYLPEDKQYVPLVEKNDNIFDVDTTMDYLADKIAQAVMEAWTSRKPSLTANGFGRAAIGMCRRVCYSDGSALMWGDTNSAAFTQLEGGNDSGIELLFAFDEAKRLTGVVANVACPAQVLEHRSFISSDYWGKVKEYVRARYGDDVKILGLCSAAGDQCPRDLIRWVNGETPVNDPNISRPDYIERDADPSMFDISGCRKVGRRIANEIFMALDEINSYNEESVFIHETLTVDLPLRRVTPAETEAAKRAIKEFVAESGDKVNFRDNARMHIYAGAIARSELQHTMDILPIEIHIMRLGNIAFATNPFELFLDYGNQIRARSRARQTFLIQLCCGCFSYLPTEKAEHGSHYSAYVSSGYVGHQGGEQLVRKTTAEINKLMAK